MKSRHVARRLSQANESATRGTRGLRQAGARGRVNRARVAASAGPVCTDQWRRATWHERLLRARARANALLWFDADHWRGFISAVRLIKLFNPTVDINSCWLYIGVGSGTLKHTEFTPKNSKKNPDGCSGDSKALKALETKIFFFSGGLHRWLEIFEEYKGPDPRSELSSRDLAAHK